MFRLGVMIIKYLLCSSDPPSYINLSIDTLKYKPNTYITVMLLNNFNELIVYREIMHRKSVQIVQSLYYVSNGLTIHWGRWVHISNVHFVCNNNRELDAETRPLHSGISPHPLNTLLTNPIRGQTKHYKHLNLMGPTAGECNYNGDKHFTPQTKS